MAKDNPFSDNPFNKSEVAHTLFHSFQRCPHACQASHRQLML